MRMFFIHARDLGNMGDMACCPYPYLDWAKRYEAVFCDVTGNSDLWGPSGMLLRDRLKDIGRKDVVVVGGGGLDGYADEWASGINDAVRRAGLAIGWGFGRNYSSHPSSCRINLDAFDLLGLRDFKNNDRRYVPCVSCLNAHIAKARGHQGGNGVGVILHKDQVYDVGSLPPGADVITHAGSMRRIVTFISEHSAIYSNSYHMLYWSALLGVPGILMHEPTNRKFLDAEFDWRGGSNAGFYGRCVELNRKFDKDVQAAVAAFRP